MSSRLRVRLRKSPISYTQRTWGTVRALGLHKVNDTVEVPDNPATRGMVRAIRFLVEVEPVGAPVAHAGGHGPAHEEAAAHEEPVAVARTRSKKASGATAGDAPSGEAPAATESPATDGGEGRP
jgi:large subunit ribosomal protein L30